MTREAAIERIKAFGLYHAIGDLPYSTRTVEAFKMAIFALEQPEIIQCKNCRHWTRTCGDDRWSLGDCDVFDRHLVMCEGYCAWAERKTDEG